MTVLPPASNRRFLSRPSVWLGAAAWIALNLACLTLANGYLPFDRPAVAGKPFALQMALPTLALAQVFLMMGLVWLMTRKRAAVDMAARSPDKAVALSETVAVLAYAMLGQAGGWLVGPAFGYRPFSFHIAGTLVGCTIPASPGEAVVWAGYNVLVFVVAPLIWFLPRYKAIDLNLVSTDRWGDLRVIAVVAVVESLVEMSAFPGVFAMTPRAFLLAAPVSFLIFFVGTVLPTMVLIYAILLPRYRRLTGSFTATVILGGLTYAVMHLVEGWSNFSSWKDTALSLMFVFLQYVPPGMFKSYFTLRTGNAWAHAIGYHAIAPHIVVDTPMIATVFNIH